MLQHPKRQNSSVDLEERRLARGKVPKLPTSGTTRHQRGEAVYCKPRRERMKKE